jgi:hypothetical protein
MSAVVGGVKNVAEFAAMATFQVVILGHQAMFIAASVGWFWAFNTFLFRGRTEHDPAELWGCTIGVVCICAITVGFLTWIVALRRAENGPVSGAISWQLLNTFGESVMIVCVFALDNAIRIELDKDVEATSAFVLCLAALAGITIVVLKAVLAAIRCCILQACCSVVACGNSGSSAEVFESAKQEASNKLVGLFTFCLSFLLALAIANAMEVVVMPQVTNSSDQTAIAWTVFAFLFGVALAVIQAERMVVRSLAAVEKGTPVQEIVTGSIGCVLGPFFKCAEGGYQSVGFFGFINSTCVYATNFTLYVAVAATLCGNNPSADNADGLLAAAFSFAVLGGVTAFGAQMYLAKLDLSDPAVISFCEDCLKFLVQGVSYVIGKLMWYGWAMLTVDQTPAGPDNWKDIMVAYIYLSLVFTFLGFASMGLVAFLAFSTGGAKSSDMQGDDAAVGDDQALAKKKIQKKLII